MREQQIVDSDESHYLNKELTNAESDMLYDQLVRHLSTKKDIDGLDSWQLAMELVP